MDRSFSVKRQLVLVGLGLLLAADLTLAGYSLQASTALRTPMAQLDADSHKLGLLNADIERAEKIRHDLPATVADCNRFDASLLPASTGNSAITAELDELAKKSGLQIQGLALRHKELAGRNITQVDLDTTVSGAPQRARRTKPHSSGSRHHRQRWLREYREVHEQFAAFSKLLRRRIA